MQAHGFRFYFTPLLGVLFTFPSRYLYTIGLTVVLSLGGWCRQIRTGFLRPRPTQDADSVRAHFAYGALTLCGGPFQAASAMRHSSLSSVLQPRAGLDPRGLGWSPFARRYSGSNCCSPFLRLLRCFSSAGWPPLKGYHASCVVGCPIRTPADRRLLASPRGFSQPAASFLASVSPGIPRAP